MDGCRKSITVVVPAYNCERYIAEALTSILTQGPAVKEVIVVDDGSTDSTCEIVRRFGPPVRLIQQGNQGPAAARNKGLKEARGDYIAFLDGDDVWLPGKLDAQLDYLEAHPDLKFVFGRISYWHPDSSGRYEHVPPEELQGAAEGIDAPVSGWIYPELLLDSAVCIIAVLMHRSVYEAVGGLDESLQTGEDYDYWLRVSRRFEMHKLSRHVARYRLHGQGATREPRPESNELKVLSRAIESFGTSGPDGRAVEPGQLRERMAKLWFDHGHLHYWHGNPVIAREAFKSTLGYRRSVKDYAYWVLSAVRTVLPYSFRIRKRNGARV